MMLSLSLIRVRPLATANKCCHSTTKTNYKLLFCWNWNQNQKENKTARPRWLSSPAKSAAVLLLVMAFSGTAAAVQHTDTFANVPQTLSGEDYKKARIQHPKSKDAERCTVKCVTTCIRGGAGSPGEGPLNARRPLVVFKEGFHSRKYCLVECSDICNLLKDGEDGP